MTSIFSAWCKKNPWFLWALGAFFYFYQSLFRSCPNVMASELIQQFQLKSTSFGWLSAAYYYPYALLQIPAGLVLDAKGPSLLLRLGLGLCALGITGFSFASSFEVALMMRVLAGVGGACGLLVTFRIGQILLPYQAQPLAMGLALALGKLGGIAANGFIGLALVYFTWSQSLRALGILGIIFAGIVMFIFPALPTCPTQQSPCAPQLKCSTRQKVKRILAQSMTSLKDVIIQPKVWAAALYGAFMYAPLALLADSWGVMFFEHTYGWPRTLSSILISFLFIGSAIGGPMVTLVEGWLDSRISLIFGSAVATTVLCLMLLTGCASAPWSAALLLLAIGLSMSGQTLAYALACHYMPASHHSTTQGLVNTAIIGITPLLQPVVGALIDLQKHLHIPSAWHYPCALSLVPLSTTIALCVCLQFKRQPSSPINQS